jgi:hypothetical protein
MAPVQGACNVGVAFHTVPASDYPLQWTFVLSKSDWFQGKVWCTTLMENTEGRGATSMFLDWSPACLDQRMIYTGVVAVAKCELPFQTLKDLIPVGKLVSIVNPSFPSLTWEDIGRDSERYVELILTHLCKNRYINVPSTDPANLTNLIRARLGILQNTIVPRTGLYPVVSLRSGNVTYGDTRLFRQYVLSIVASQL